MFVKEQEQVKGLDVEVITHLQVLQVDREHMVVNVL